MLSPPGALLRCIFRPTTFDSHLLDGILWCDVLLRKAQRAAAVHGTHVLCMLLGDSERVPVASGVCQAASAAAVSDHALEPGYVLTGAGMTHSLSNRSTAWPQEHVLGARTQVISESCSFNLLVKVSDEGCSVTSLLLVFHYCHSEFP